MSAFLLLYNLKICYNNKKMIDSFFKKVFRLVDPKIKEVLDISVDQKTKDLVNYQVSTGGKRLRPVLAVASCLACRGKIKDVLYAAAGLEILHNCTLIFDDIIDNSFLRRGRKTVWSKYGKSIAQCVGLDYTAAIFQAANRSVSGREISELFANTMKKIIEGEILDILFEQSGRQDEKYVASNRYRKIAKKDYLEMISKKTASLTEASCEAGAVCTRAKKKERRALKKYGFNLGMAFQIRDDILDIFGQESKFGKKIGKDIEEKKMGNIVIFYTLQELSSKKDKKRFMAIFMKNKVSRKDIKQAMALINKTRAKEKALVLEEKYASRAREGLQGLTSGKWKSFLAQIADFVVERNK